MSSGFDAEQFKTTVRNVASEILAETETGSEARAAREVYRLSEETHEKHGTRVELIDCRAGCSHCCIVNVSVLEPEAAAIFEYLIEQRSDAELRLLQSELHNLNIETRWLDDEERIMTRRSCAFLSESGSCSIYPVRPLLCRAMTSTDASACKDALSMLALDENRPVVSNLLQLELFETAFTGLGMALGSQDFEDRSVRLTGAVSQLLNDYLH